MGEGERRYYGLDALRGGMMMLGVVLHASQMYLVAPPPTIPFPGDPNSSRLFDLLFHFGYLARPFPAFFQTAARHVWRYALLAAALFPLALYASHLEYAAGKAPGAELHMAAVLANGLCTWALVYFFIGSALRYFDYAANWILYASQASYWVFLWHLPMVMLAAWWLMPYDLPALLKFSLVVAFTATLCFASYHFLVQRTWMGVFLNGRRFHLPWAWR